MAAEDLFAQFFGGGSFGGGGGLGGMFGGMGGQSRGPPKARTIHHTHKVSLEDIYKGKISKLALQRSIICPKCDGRGGKEGAVKRCTGCDGHGMKTMMRQMGPMIQRFQTVCPDCNGEGEIVKEKDRCKGCNGKKTIVDRKVLHVHVDKGVRSGTKVEFRGEGDQAPGVQAGDVVFEIEQKPHARFTRKEDDLFYQCEIELVTALAGGKIFIEHLDERWLSIEIMPGEAIANGKQPKTLEKLFRRTLTHSVLQRLSRWFAARVCLRLGTTTTVTCTSSSQSSSPSAPGRPTRVPSRRCARSFPPPPSRLFHQPTPSLRKLIWRMLIPRAAAALAAVPWTKMMRMVTLAPSASSVPRNKVAISHASTPLANVHFAMDNHMDVIFDKINAMATRLLHCKNSIYGAMLNVFRSWQTCRANSHLLKLDGMGTVERSRNSGATSCIA